MILKKILGLVAAAAAIAAAAVLCVVTLALALFAALRDVIGPAWAYAAVAGATLLFVALALLITHKAKPKASQQGPEADLLGNLFELAKRKPLVAAAAAAAAGAVVLRNPAIISGLVAAFLAPSGPRRPR